MKFVRTQFWGILAFLASITIACRLIFTPEDLSNFYLGTVGVIVLLAGISSLLDCVKEYLQDRLQELEDKR